MWLQIKKNIASIGNHLTPDEDGFVADRRIMPRDEQDRRDGLLISEPQSFEATMDDVQWQDIADETPFLLGKVVEVSRSICRAEVNNEVIVCDVRGILTAEGIGLHQPPGCWRSCPG